jgi:hypothetical protein
MGNENRIFSQIYQGESKDTINTNVGFIEKRLLKYDE